MPKPDASTEGTGLVVALPAEAHSLGVRGLRVGGCARWRHGWVAISGIGPRNAMRAAERLLACGVDRLANWGVAGALEAGLSPGDVLIPDRIRHVENDPGFATDDEASERLVAALSSRMHVHRGTLWSTQRPLASAADKRALAERSGAVAVDMEAASIAAIAARAGLPFVAVKAICDPVTRELPAPIVRALNGSGGGFSPRVLSAIALGGPATWRATRSLARDFAQARHSLATAAILAA
jgi:hypothetical protein